MMQTLKRRTGNKNPHPLCTRGLKGGEGKRGYVIIEEPPTLHEGAEGRRE